MNPSALAIPLRDRGAFSSMPDSSITLRCDTDSRPTMRTSRIRGRSTTSRIRMFLPSDWSSLTATSS